MDLEDGRLGVLWSKSRSSDPLSLERLASREKLVLLGALTLTEKVSQSTHISQEFPHANEREANLQNVSGLPLETVTP